jgi:hypothetical protein
MSGGEGLVGRVEEVGKSCEKALINSSPLIPLPGGEVALLF